MVDLVTNYLGLRLSGPVIASAGPTTGRVEGLLELEAAGAAALVLPSIFEEEVGGRAPGHLLADRGDASLGQPGDVFPYTDFYADGPERHVRLVEEATLRLSVPVIASVSAVRPGPWRRYVAAVRGADGRCRPATSSRRY